MLDLKLKAWCYELGEFVCIKYLEFIDEDISYMHAQDKNGEDIEPPYASERLGIDWELLQYTGRKDANDDDVYVGHILEYTVTNSSAWIGDIAGFTQVGVVSYDKWDGFRYTTVRHISGKDMNLGIPMGHLDNFKIVGNIYENHELLGAEAYW